MIREFIKRILNNAPVTGNVIKVSYTLPRTHKVFDAYLVMCVRDIHYVPQIGYNLILNEQELKTAYERQDKYVDVNVAASAPGHIQVSELVTKHKPNRKTVLGMATVCQDGVEHKLCLPMQQLERAHSRYTNAKSLLVFHEQTFFRRVVLWLHFNLGRYIKRWLGK